MATWSIAALRAILATETDADSPGSQELMDQIRENIEALLLLCFADGFTGTCTVIAEAVLTHADAAQVADEHDGRTLLITSGDAIGNMYTIDDTAAQTITCTGDTMATDGVAKDDTFAILYDMKTNTDGHDHDGVNSKELGIALKAGGLNTSLSEVSVAQGVSSHETVTGGSYCFWPQIKETGGQGLTAQVATAYTGGATYATIINLDYAGGSDSGYAQFRYINASGEVFWIYLLKDIATGEILARSAAPDHVCFGNGGNPETIPHPFCDYDPALHEVVIITPTKSEVKKIRKDARKQGKSFLQIFVEEYEVDELSSPTWPDVPVTVDLDEDIETGKKIVIKEKVVKQDYFKHKKLKKKSQEVIL